MLKSAVNCIHRQPLLLYITFFESFSSQYICLLRTNTLSVSNIQLWACRRSTYFENGQPQNLPLQYFFVLLTLLTWKTTLTRLILHTCPPIKNKKLRLKVVLGWKKKMFFPNYQCGSFNFSSDAHWVCYVSEVRVCENDIEEYVRKL